MLKNKIKSTSGKKSPYLIIFIILAIIGVVLIAFGISNVVKASKMEIPAMREPGWFDATNEQTNTRSAGIAEIFFGFTILIFGAFPLVKKAINKIQTQVLLSRAENNAQAATALSEKLEKIVETEKRSDTIECAYCGAKNKKDSLECRKCGAPLKDKKK